MGIIKKPKCIFTWTGHLLAGGEGTHPTCWVACQQLSWLCLLRKACVAVSSWITLWKILLESNIASTGCSGIFSRSSGADGGLRNQFKSKRIIRSIDLALTPSPIVVTLLVFQSYCAPPPVFHLAASQCSISIFSGHNLRIQAAFWLDAKTAVFEKEPCETQITLCSRKP